MTNKIYIVDLLSYNNDVARGQWVDLPCEVDELKEIIDKLSHNGEHDIGIHDYELPFEIHESIDVFELNSIIMHIDEYDLKLNEITTNIKSNQLVKAYEQLRNVVAFHLDYRLNNYDAIQMCNDFCDYETANDMAKLKMENGTSLKGMYNFIKNIDFSSEELYKIDGYGNLKTATKHDIVVLYDDIIDMLVNEIKINI